MINSIKRIRLVIIITIIFFGTSTFVWLTIKNYYLSLNSVLSKQENLVRIQKSNLENEFENTLSILKNKSDPISYTLNNEFNEKLIINLLNTILNRKTHIHAVYLLDNQGTIIKGLDKELINSDGSLTIIRASHNMTHKDIPHLNLSDPEINIPIKNKIYISPPKKGLNEMLFKIATPIVYKDSISGILLTYIKVDEIWKKYSSTIKNSFSLMDTEGNIIAENWNYNKIHHNKDDALIQELLNSNSSIIQKTYAQENGETMYEIGAKIEKLNWIFISETPSNYLLSPIYDSIIRFSLFFILIIVFVVIIINKLIAKLAKSIRNLITSFERSEKGDYQQIKTTSEISELEILQNGFNSMIITIKERENELQTREKKFREIFNSYIDIYYEADLEGKFQLLTPSVFNITGYTRDELIGTKLSDKYKDPSKRDELLIGLKKYGKVENYQSILYAKDGSELLLEANVKWRKDKNKNITGVIGTVRNINDREKLAVTIKQLKEKETLLKEIHHRVKNNLQIVAGIIDMKGRRSKNEEVKLAFNDLKLKIKTISLIHEKLYQTEHLSSINFCSHIESLFSEIQNMSIGTSVKPNFHFPKEAINVSIDQAVPLGLIANELITNSIKYGINEKTNTIDITLKKNGDILYFEVKDNGPGLPKNFNELRKTSLGYRMIDALAGQLDSKLIITCDKGTSTSLKIKLDTPIKSF